MEAEVQRDGDVVLMQWARDSAFRFFPLVEHEEMGLVLHPFDLATSKVLALVGRLEVRDWIDVIECHDRLQPLGYLAWAACGLGAYGIMLFGICVLGISTALLDAKVITGFWWMTLTGLGSYLAYVPVGSVLFERILASTRFVGTAVFAIYVADALG